jgi:hypothetical protein
VYKSINVCTGESTKLLGDNVNTILQDLHLDIPQGTGSKSTTATVITAGGYLNGLRLDSTVTYLYHLISAVGAVED